MDKLYDEFEAKIAGFIGVIFISMLLPVFSLQDYIK